MRKPFYRSSRNAWFVVGPGGKFIRLHEDDDKAFDIWNAMRDTGKKAGHPHLTVPTLASRFLTEQELILKKPRYTLVEY